MLFDMFVTVIVMQVTTLFEIEVKNLIFIVKQFLDNECSITPETLKNKIWICRKLSHPCTITFKRKLSNILITCDQTIYELLMSKIKFPLNGPTKTSP